MKGNIEAKFGTKGDNITLNCQLPCKDPLQVRWSFKKDGNLWLLRYDSGKYLRSIIGNRCSITIFNLSEEDEHQYECRIGSQNETHEIIIQNTTTEVKIVYDKISGIATCTANIIPELTLQWKYSEDKDNGELKIASIGHNATIDKTGYYVCVAVDANGIKLNQSDYLYNDNGEVHSEENNSFNSDGMILGMMILVIAIFIVGTLFTYWRRIFCFKKRTPVPTNQPNNIENGVKIQPMNSPYSKKKTEMKIFAHVTTDTPDDSKIAVIS